MCEFLSALVLRNGDVLWHEATDSHSDLVRHFRLPDNTECRHFAKIEFTPRSVDGNPNYLGVDHYALRVDEDTEPIWFDEVRELVEQKCRSIIRGMIVTDKRDFLLGGKWILAGNACVRAVKSSHLVSVSDSAQIKYVSGSAQIKSVSGSAQIESVSGSAQIKYVSDSAQITNNTALPVGAKNT